MNTYNLIYLSTLKEAIGVESSYSDDDAVMARCIESATLTIEKLLGRSLSKNTHTEIKDAPKNYVAAFDYRGYSDSGVAIYSDPRCITLKHYPVDENTTVQVYYDVNSVFGADTLLDASQYSIDYEQGLIWLNISTMKSRRSVKVVYSAGYETVVDGSDTSIEPNLPADLVQAAIWQAHHIYDKNRSSNINSAYSGAQGSTNSYRYINVAGLVPEAMRVVAEYRRPKIAVI